MRSLVLVTLQLLTFEALVIGLFAATSVLVPLGALFFGAERLVARRWSPSGP